MDQKTNLYIKKAFSSLLGKDHVSVEINYEKLGSGVIIGSTTVLIMPAQKMKIDAKNQDYSRGEVKLIFKIAMKVQQYNCDCLKALLVCHYSHSQALCIELNY